MATRRPLPPYSSSSDDDDDGRPAFHQPPAPRPPTAGSHRPGSARPRSAKLPTPAMIGDANATFQGVRLHPPSVSRLRRPDSSAHPGLQSSLAGAPGNTQPSDVPLHYAPSLSRFGRATVDHARQYRFETVHHAPLNFDLVVAAHRELHTNRGEYPTPDAPVSPTAAQVAAAQASASVNANAPGSPMGSVRFDASVRTFGGDGSVSRRSGTRSRRQSHFGPTQAERAASRQAEAAERKRAAEAKLASRKRRDGFNLTWRLARNDDMRTAALKGYSLRDHDVPFVPPERKFMLRADRELLQAAFEDAEIAAEARRPGARPSTPRSVAKFFADSATAEQVLRGVDNHEVREQSAVDEMAAADEAYNRHLRATITQASQQYYCAVGESQRMFPTSQIVPTAKTAARIAAGDVRASVPAVAPAAAAATADTPLTHAVPGKPPRSRPTSARRPHDAATPTNLKLPQYSTAGGAASAAAPHTARVASSGGGSTSSQPPKPPSGGGGSSRPTSARRPTSAKSRPASAATPAAPTPTIVAPDPTNPRDCHAWVGSVVPPTAS